MRFRSLFSELGWAAQYAGLCVLYVLRWGGKSYVGSSRNIASRLYWWRRNLAGTEVRVRVVCAVSECSRFEAEEALIRKLRTLHPHGHNKTAHGKAGGVVGHTVSEPVRRKISATNPGKRRTEEAKLKMSLAKRGKPRDPVASAKAAESNRGKIRTEAQRARIAASVVGKPKSEAHKAALRAAWVRRRAATNNCQGA